VNLSRIFTTNLHANETAASANVKVGAESQQKPRPPSMSFLQMLHEGTNVQTAPPFNVFFANVARGDKV
jgi:hypothetical protein